VARADSESPVPDAVPSAEVTFATPQRFAIVSAPHATARYLYARGELVPDPKTPGQGCLVEEVQPDGLLLREPRSQKTIRVAVGTVLPNTGGRRLEGTVLLDGVEYHYVPPGTAPAPEPRLLQIRERRAHLAVETTAPPLVLASSPAPAAPAPASERPLELPQRLEKTILEKVRVKPAGRDTYEIPKADAQLAFDHGGQILMEALATVRPTLSLDQGITFRVQSAAADGVLGPHGFRVISPNLAERAGLEAGDVVLAVNGQPIHGLGDLYRLYQQVKADPRLAVVELNLQRQGQLLTKTYRIR
jgi:hypothetical protein